MDFCMVFAAEPAYFEWLGIIVVVPFRLWIAADLTGLSNQCVGLDGPVNGYVCSVLHGMSDDPSVIAQFGVVV